MSSNLSSGIPLYHCIHNDWGSGRPVVLIHGWPLNADMWSDQAVTLAERGYRVIAYDRRGFGRSSQPWNGYTYDTMAADLAALLDALDLRGVALVGFSMGGGEVARYLGRYGAGRVAKAALVSAVTPFLLKTLSNPDGVDKATFDGIVAGLEKDRPHFLAGFAQHFYGNGLIEKKVSTEVLQWSLQMAMMGSLRATVECVRAFSETDFRPDMAAFTMPTLIIHGTDDQTVPIEKSGEVTARMIPHATLLRYDGEPHGLMATAKTRLADDLVAFLAD